MSSHFSANQYESAFSSQRLQNYQISANHKEKPSLRKGKTTIISNERGHLNTSVRHSSASPWGSFVGTWQTERKPIDIKTKTRLLTYVAQSGMSLPGSRRSTRASSARSASTRGGSPQNVNDPNEIRSPTPNIASPVNTPTPQPEAQPRVTSPTGNVNSRPSTTSSIRSSMQGSRVQSPTSSVHSPTPLIGSRAVSASVRSVTIVSPPSTAEYRQAESPTSEPPRPQSPLNTGHQSRLHTSETCSPVAQLPEQSLPVDNSS